MSFPRTILIGTMETLDLLHRQLATLPMPPVIVGAVRAENSGEPNLAPPPPGLIMLGRIEEVTTICRSHQIGHAVISLPATMTHLERQTRGKLAQLGVRVRVVKPLSEVLASEPMDAPVRTGHSIDLAALVGRRPHPADREQLSKLLSGSRVLITGAGGSIGSEIARVCAGFDPATLVLVERSENALFEIDRELGARFPDVPRQAVLHDVVDQGRTDRLVAETAPDVVFHAAAHKHVPLMEDHPAHAVTNNLFGTRAIADASMRHGVGRFVLISSDKAVNPTSVMGATKRLAEMYVQGLGGRSRTRLSMVRFGNVLGSACSVLPIWASQIAEGGPVTVTDERMTRYFMTIPEAAGLVTHAASLSLHARAEVFVLDMGEPISIYELAERFIRSHGLTPVREDEADPAAWDQIAIRLSGIRPGEKLHEELAYDKESLRRTAHPGILALTDTTRPDEATLAAMIEHLDRARTDGSAHDVVAAIGRFVPQLASRRVAA